MPPFILSMSPPGYPSAGLRPRSASFRFARQEIIVAPPRPVVSASGWDVTRDRPPASLVHDGAQWDGAASSVARSPKNPRTTDAALRWFSVKWKVGAPR